MNTHPRSGSALLTTIIFSSILALILIPTYLTLSQSTLSISNRAHYNVATINLAESGIEYAVHTLRSASNDSSVWEDWSVAGPDAYLQMPNSYYYAGSIRGTLSLYISNYQSNNPQVLSKASIPLPGGSVIQKYMYANVTTSSASGLFAYGMLVKEFIHAEGGVVFNSWISDPDNNPDTPFQFYSDSLSRDQVAIATVSTANAAISLGSSDVYGSAAIGSGSYSGLSVGWGGHVGPEDMSEWDPSDYDRLWAKDPPGWKVSTQTGALTTNFTATFEDISDYGSADMSELTDPRATYELPYIWAKEVSNAWSTWTENVYIDEETIGTPGMSSVLELRELEVKAGATLRIEGDVVIYLPEEDTATLKVIEGGAIELADDATLTIYVAGDVEVTGAGIFSEVAPQQFQLWGTASDSQEIDFLNNGQFSGVIYAPNASVRITGNSDLYGSIVANDITLTGSGSFRYDESLADYTGGFTSPGPPQVTFVEELTGDERTPYLSLFADVGL